MTNCCVNNAITEGTTVPKSITLVETSWESKMGRIKVCPILETLKRKNQIQFQVQEKEKNWQKFFQWMNEWIQKKKSSNLNLIVTPWG